MNDFIISYHCLIVYLMTCLVISLPLRVSAQVRACMLLSAARARVHTSFLFHTLHKILLQIMGRIRLKGIRRMSVRRKARTPKSAPLQHNCGLAATAVL